MATSLSNWILCCLASMPGGEPISGSPDGCFHYLAQPEYRLTYSPRLPLEKYCPQPGDIVLSTTGNRLATLRYALALTWRPTHVGIIVRMNNGELGVLEAGGGDSHETRISSLADRFERITDAGIWIRRIQSPLSSEQSAELTRFANRVNGLPYAKRRQNAQATIFRSRGPLRTFFLGGPRGIRDDYICSEVVLEALVHIGRANPETTRPSATYPRDLFFDRSANLYIHMHPALACDWAPPALWVRACGLSHPSRLGR